MIHVWNKSSKTNDCTDPAFPWPFNTVSGYCMSWERVKDMKHNKSARKQLTNASLEQWSINLAVCQYKKEVKVATLDLDETP